MKLIPRDWIDHQHYKDRNPPWIKLHKKLLNNRSFMCLPLASKALAPLLWLLASESKDGIFLATHEELEFRLRITKKDLEVGLKPLIDNGFFSVASNPLAERLQVAPKSCSETETETETETESGFVLFWSMWPKSQRKQAMGKCKEVWVKGRFEKQSAEIVAHVEALKICDDWQKNNGQFIPAPIVYLNGRRWEGASNDRPAINEFAGAL